MMRSPLGAILYLDNLALRQQPAIHQRRQPRPRLRQSDRLFWIWFSKPCKDSRSALVTVKPETKGRAAPYNAER
jgi:hypothetical protein